MKSKLSKKKSPSKRTAKQFARRAGSTSLVFSLPGQDIKFAFERGALTINDPEKAWKDWYFLTAQEVEQLRRWLNREAKLNEKGQR